MRTISVIADQERLKSLPPALAGARETGETPVQTRCCISPPEYAVLSALGAGATEEPDYAVRHDSREGRMAEMEISQKTYLVRSRLPAYEEDS